MDEKVLIKLDNPKGMENVRVEMMKMRQFRFFISVNAPSAT